MSNVLGLYIRTDSPGKADGREFSAQCRRFADKHVGYTIGYDYYTGNIRRRELRNRVIKDLESYSDKGVVFDSIAIFCHGWANGIQLGFRVSDGTVCELAEAIHGCLAMDGSVALYCCSTAHDRDEDDDEEVGPGTQGGFADELFVELLNLGNIGHTIDAHMTRGHTTRNPWVVRFQEDGLDIYNGDWLVTPNSSLWRRWVMALRNTELQYQFPMMDENQIVRSLTDVGTPPAPPNSRWCKNQA